MKVLIMLMLGVFIGKCTLSNNSETDQPCKAELNDFDSIYDIDSLSNLGFICHKNSTINRLTNHFQGLISLSYSDSFYSIWRYNYNTWLTWDDKHQLGLCIVKYTDTKLCKGKSINRIYILDRELKPYLCIEQGIEQVRFFNITSDTSCNEETQSFIVEKITIDEKYSLSMQHITYASLIEVAKAIHKRSYHIEYRIYVNENRAITNGDNYSFLYYVNWKYQ